MPTPAPAPAMHRICLPSWELLHVFRGAVIPREGETVMLEKDGRESKYRVTSVSYKLAAGGEFVATVFVTPV